MFNAESVPTAALFIYLFKLIIKSLCICHALCPQKVNEKKGIEKDKPYLTRHMSEQKAALSLKLESTETSLNAGSFLQTVRYKAFVNRREMQFE